MFSLLAMLISAAGLGFLIFEFFLYLVRGRRITIWFLPATIFGLGLLLPSYKFFHDGSTEPWTDFLIPLAIFAVLLGIVWRGGRRKSEDSNEWVLRGSSVMPSSQLMKALYGRKVKAVTSNPLFVRLGSVSIPYPVEAQHILFSGTTGSGKTQAINRVLKAIRLRNKRALISDPGGGFLSRFYRDGDVIFNPFDKRSVDWSPFAEIRAEYDCARIAKAAIPDGFGESQEWHHFAQTLLGETMLAMHKRRQRSIKQLLNYLTVADAEPLAQLLADTPAAILCARGNERMLSNTRAIISKFLVGWRYLDDDGRFSVREWVRDESHSSWFFVTFRDDQFALLSSTIATLLELGIVEGLSLPEDPERDLWFVMDELDSLGKVTSLRAGLTKLRKYGCKCVLGIQTISQLRTTYGNDEAQTLLANISTKIVLRAGDGETAEYFSKEFGEQEISRWQHSSSSGTNGGASSSSTSTTAIRETKRTVLASEIATLQDLHGFLKLPGVPIGIILLQYEELPISAPPYVENGAAGIVVDKPNEQKSEDCSPDAPSHPAERPSATHSVSASPLPSTN